MPGVAPAPLTASALEFVATLATGRMMLHHRSHQVATVAPPNGLLHVRSVESPVRPREGHSASKSVSAQPAESGPPGVETRHGAAAVLTPLPPLRRARALEIVRPGPDLPVDSDVPVHSDVPVDSDPALPTPAHQPDEPGYRPVGAEGQLVAEPARPSVIEARPAPLSAVRPEAAAGAPPMGTKIEPEPRGRTWREATSGPGLRPETVPTQPPEGAVVRPIRPNLAQSRRMGLGPGYHGTLPEAIRLERAERELVAEPPAPPPPSRATTPVPDEVRTELRSAYGVDVDVFHHGPEVSAEAQRMGARAFTRDGQVFIPREAGPIDTPEGRATVAHELTHAAQQRRTGGVLPPEDSPGGRVLEEEAQGAERWFRGDSGARRPGTRPEPPVDSPSEHDQGVDDARALMKRLVADGFAVSDGAGGVRFNPGSTGSTPGVQRQTAAAPAAPAAAGAPPAGFDPLGSFAHGLAEDIGGFAQGIAVSTFGLGKDDRDQMAADRTDRDQEFQNARQRDYASQQFQELRLEHRRREVTSQRGTTELASAEQAHLETEIHTEVENRLTELDQRVAARLDAVNQAKATAESERRARQPNAPPAAVPVVHVLEPAAYARVVQGLFGNPDGPMPADDPADVTAAATAAAAAHAAAGPAGGAAGAGASTGGATGAAPGAAPAGAATAATATAGSGTAGAATGTADAGTAGTGPPGGGTGGGAGAGAGAHRGVSPAGAAAPQNEWKNFDDVGHTLANDMLGVLGTEFGLQLSADETAQVTGRSAAAPAAAAGRSAATHSIADHHGEVGPSGHELLDLDHIDIDALSVRLYERLRQQLRQELLVDRERAGMLTDFR